MLRASKHHISVQANLLAMSEAPIDFSLMSLTSRLATLQELSIALMSKIRLNLEEYILARASGQEHDHFLDRDTVLEELLSELNTKEEESRVELAKRLANSNMDFTIPPGLFPSDSLARNLSDDNSCQH